MATNPTEWYRDSRQYLTEVTGEYQKITWPPQKEAVAGTIGVVVSSAIVATVLGIVDFGLSRIIRLILQ